MPMLSYFKNNKILIFLLLSWVALWASINSYPMPLDISISYLQKINFTKMASFPDGLNILRIYTPLLLINSILFFL